MKFMGWQRIEIIVLAIVVIGATCQARAKENSPLAFITEYIRELSTNENTRAKAEQELKDAATTSDKLSSAIHASTLIQLELGSQIRTLRDTHFSPPFDKIIPIITESYELKITFLQKMIDNSSAFLVGPKPDVDYDKLATDMPKIRAFLDDIDHTLFESTPIIFAVLIDQRADSQNHLNHLVITKADREKLVHDLTVSFGEKLEQKNQNYIVSSASVLKAYLLKDYKCADDPWQ